MNAPATTATSSFLRLDFDALLSFAVFADTLNFSAAARQLHISQPALHVKVRKLGEQLGRTLYLRHGRSLELTEHGEAVARFGRQLRTGADAFLGALRGAAEQPLSLAAGEGAYLYLLGAGIRAYQREARSRLRLANLDRDGTVAAVTSGKAQLGVAPLESLPDSLMATHLTTVGQVLAVPAAHRFAARSRLKLADLAGERLIVPPAGRPQRQMLGALLQSQQVPWEVAMEATGWELMLHFVALDAGVAVVNACCRLPKGVVAVALPELPSLRYHCFHLRGLPAAAPVMRLRAVMLAHGDQWRTRHG
jgi:LysR family transcriptional regulator, low CO2-responsive transcriptional regulator